MAPEPKGTGWERQPDDPRDWIYQPPPNQKITDYVDLHDTHRMPRVIYDQGFVGSCTANAIAAALKFSRAASVGARQTDLYAPSRLFIYFHERILRATKSDILPVEEIGKIFVTNVRVLTSTSGQKYDRQKLEDAIKGDGGAYERDGFKALNKFGVCSESTWPYINDNSVEAYYTPPPNAMAEGPNYMDSTFRYYRIKDLGDGAGPSTLAHVEAALAEGYPVIFGFDFPSTHDQLSSDAPTGLDREFVYTGWVNEGDTTFGHCVVAVGYDRKKRLVQVLNSWGDKWGNKGCYYMSYDFFSDKPARGGTGFWQRGKKQFPRVDDIWVLKSPRPEAGTAGSNVTRETSRNV